MTNSRGVAADDEKHGANREFAVLQRMPGGRRRGTKAARAADPPQSAGDIDAAAGGGAGGDCGDSIFREKRTNCVSQRYAGSPLLSPWRRDARAHCRATTAGGFAPYILFSLSATAPCDASGVRPQRCDYHKEESGVGPTGPGIDCSGCVPIGDATPPERPHIDPQPVKLLRVTHLDPAMITTRVEPVYPALPKQMRREGRVELRAIISTEGRIESLEAVGGDALFYQSAKDAVRQWRYKPTILNGSAVEVETYITIIYTLDK